MGKMKNYISEKGDKIKTSVKIDKAAPWFYISLILIIVLAILIRCSPAVNGITLIKAFDPWYQYDSVQKLVDVGLYDWLHLHDYQFWFPEGVDRFNLRPGLLVTNALIYEILNGIGIPISLYTVCFYFPAFMGGLTVLVMYHLGKEILDRRAGLIAAFFLAFSPGHIQRTVVGFFDNETIGVFAVLATFLFFIKAVKYGKLSDSVLAGLSIGYLALSWGGLTFAFVLIPLIIFIIILIDKYDPKILMAYSVSIISGLMIYSINPDFNWERYFFSMDFYIPFIFQIFLIGYHWLYMQKGTDNYEKIINSIKWIAIPLIMIVLIIFWVDPNLLPFDLQTRLMSIINPNIRETLNIVASVGEHAPSPWSVFYFNSFVPIYLLVPGIYFALRRGKLEDVFMVVFVLTLFYFTGSMIRIILLFAPAVALIAGYALSNILKYFGALMKKEQTITRRRKRQIQKTVGISEGVVVYVAIGLLLFAQVSHAVDFAETQMPYTDLIPANYFHDWEESLSWMDNNLDSSTVVVSWWDYGYWLSSIGDVTTVNDNGTWNQTRIGLTGMGMMQDNERYSAEIFQKLQAEYVVVYFGHLLSYIGGDEGKWPWMLRICNDNTESYQAMGLEKDNWYGSETAPVNTVFDEKEFVNSTNGAYLDRWFQTTLAKLMFYQETISTASLNSQSPSIMNYAQEIEGTADVDARVDNDGDLWSTHNTVNGEYKLKYFTPTYYSANRLIKVFKVDYGALESSLEINDFGIDTDGNGYVQVENTGSNELDINGIKLGYSGSLNSINETAITFEANDKTIAPSETKYVGFNTDQIKPTWTTSEIYNLTVNAVYTNEEGVDFSIENSTISAQIVDRVETSFNVFKPNSSIFIQPDNNSLQANIGVQNTGMWPLVLDKIIMEDIYTQDISETNRLISPQSINQIEFSISNISFSDFPHKFYSHINVQIESTANEFRKSNIAFSRPGFGISIVGDFGNLPEEDYLYDYSTYSRKLSNAGEYFINYDEDSYLFDNGTLEITISNSGDELLAINEIYANDTSITNFDILEGSLFMDTGDITKIRAQIDDVGTNVPVEVKVIGISNGTVAADTANFVPRNKSQMISIISGTNSMTAAFTNESLRLVVKNTGSDSVILGNIAINGTAPITVINSMIVEGTTTTTTLQPDDIVILEVAFTNLKVNLSDIVEVKIDVAGHPEISNTVELTARLPTAINVTEIEIHDGNSHFSGATQATATLYVSVDHNQTVTLDSLFYKLTENGEYIAFASLIKIDGVPLDESTAILTGYESGSERIYSIEIDLLDLTLGLGVDINIMIRTEEGYEDSEDYTISDS